MQAQANKPLTIKVTHEPSRGAWPWIVRLDGHRSEPLGSEAFYSAQDECKANVAAEAVVAALQALDLDVRREASR